jgi:hypothetical protein
MKKLLIALTCLVPLSSSVFAGIKCPHPSLIEENINAFLNDKKNKDDFREGRIVLDSKTWIFESNLISTDIKRNMTKSLNLEISDIDEHTCNYLIYPTDSDLEDVSLTLRALTE